MAAHPEGTRPRLSLLGAAAAVLGLVLFAWSVRQAGLSTVLDGIRRVGAGFLLIMLLSGLRFWVRSEAWALATESAPALRTRETFPALVAGDALGNVTPLGLFVSEPVKAAFLRPRVRLMTALAGIAVENLSYTLTVVLVIAAGVVALLFLFDASATIRHVALGVLVVAVIAIAAAIIVVMRQVKVITPAAEWLERAGRGRALVPYLERLRTLEDLVVSFAHRYPRKLAAMLGLEFAFHVLGVAEIWFTLGLLVGAAAPTLLTTFVLESVNRAITVVFKFVPLRLGVDEVGTELLTRTLGLPLGVGVTMAVVRKARMIAWSAIGVAFLARRGLTRSALAE